MDTTEKARRPLILEVDDAKQQIFQTINEAIQVRGIPCVILEPILNDILTQVRLRAREELTIAKQHEIDNE